MKHPIWIALAAGLAVLLAALAMPLWHMLSGAPTALVAAPQVSASPGATPGLPWQVKRLPEGRSEVFGLTLGQDTLAQLSQRFEQALQVALVAKVNETGQLEALVEPMNAGFVSGRLVAGFEVPAALLASWRSRAGSSEVMAGGARRFKLSAEDRAQAESMPISSLSFVPSVRLGEADVRERFGAPAETVALPDQTTALLYPELGLLALVQPGSRGVLQYVQPGQFDQKLRAPLAAAR